MNASTPPAAIIWLVLAVLLLLVVLGVVGLVLAVIRDRGGV
jgi:hypothetical protein